MDTVSLNVKGMHCRSCEMLISESLEEEKGIQSAVVSHKDGKVTVKFDKTKVSMDRIKKIIEESGYKVE